MTPPARGLRIAIVGAESTGKTTLARELASALARPAPAGSSPASTGGARVALVGEVLREWCDAAGRTPRADEQRAILVEQHRRVDDAAATHDIVVSDTTALMTHVYSDLLFDDRSLLPLAVERHRAIDATLLTALDLPWVADGHQRDGEHVRRPVDDRLREVLHRHRLPFSVVAGHGPARLAQALAALRPLFETALRPLPEGVLHPPLETALQPPLEAAPAGDRLPPAPAPRGAPGLFTRLATTRAGTSRLGWVCDCCVPEAEQALLRAREQARLEAAGAADGHRA